MDFVYKICTKNEWHNFKEIKLWQGTKKGGGKLIVKEVFKVIKKSNHLNRLVTLSPLTEMARNFHLRNGAVEVQINETTQNFEYIFLK